MGFPAVGLVTFFSYDPWCLYPETYPEVSTISTRPALPLPRPLGSKRSLCDPVNLVVSVRRLTVGEATARCEKWNAQFFQVIHIQKHWDSFSLKSYRDPSNDWRLSFNQLDHLSLSVLSCLVFVFLPGQLSKCTFKLVKCDGSTGFLSGSWTEKRENTIVN